MVILSCYSRFKLIPQDLYWVVMLLWSAKYIVESCSFCFPTIGLKIIRHSIAKFMLIISPFLLFKLIRYKFLRLCWVIMSSLIQDLCNLCYALILNSHSITRFMLNSVVYASFLWLGLSSNRIYAFKSFYRKIHGDSFSFLKIQSDSLHIL